MPLRLTGLLPLILLAAACARVGPPLPPLPRVPQPPAEAVARLEGDQVRLDLRLPDRNADGSAIEAVTALEISPLFVPAGEADGQPRPAGPGRAIPLAGPDIGPGRAWSGPIGDADSLSGTGDWASGGNLHLLVRVQNERGRWSPPAALTAIPLGRVAATPPSPRATPGKAGVRLEWPAPDVNQDGSRPAVWDGSQILRAVAGVDEAEIARVDAPATDWVDGSVEPNRQYHYRVAYFRRVDAGEIRSAPSQPVEADTRDVFAPDTPAGLTLIPDDTQRPVLVWSPVIDPDTVGYLVERTRLPDGLAQVLTPEPIRATTFTDPEPEPGAAYHYRVAAIDRNGNRSPFSAPVTYPPQR